MAEGGFTARSLAIGVFVGVLGAVSNVYVSLKAGWSLPVMTTAAVVGLGVARLQRRSLGRAEAVVATALASSTAFATGGGNLAAVPAFVILGGLAPAPVAWMAWFATSALAGTLLAPLFARRLRELRFPTASAVATLVEEGGEGITARALWLATLAAGAFALARKVARVPASFAAPYTFGIDTSLLLVAVGGLMTWTTAWSTLVGALLTYGLIAPSVVAAGLAEATYRSLVAFMVWPASALLVTSALTELLLDLLRAKQLSVQEARSPHAYLVLVPGALALLVGRLVFGMSWLVVLAAIPISLAFAFVGARSMGETDVVPTRALMPLAQALFGLAGTGLVAPTIAPNLPGAAAIHAADTLGSLKMAAALDVPARAALRARVVGCVLGAVVVVVAFGAIVPDIRALPTKELPVPGVLIWTSVAAVINAGQLPTAMHAPIAIGAVIGLVLAVLGRVLPERARPFVPSAMGIGSGMVLPASMSLSILLGALARRQIEARLGPSAAVAIASGTVAGESVVGVVLQLLG